MVSLQEYANRAQNPPRYQGVSVYSPTRPVIRPSGTTANRGTAQRILGGGQRQPGQFNTTPSRSLQMQLPSYRPPDQPGQGRTSLDDILDQMDANSPQPAQAEEPGGWRGALGTVVNSLPFKAIMAPLNILDIPRRAVVSTVNEVADAFNGGDASWEDWFDQVKDPNFGFGSVIGSTGNVWADRFIGFAGDVALDPLTYVAGAGVFAGTGRSMRQRLAGLAVSEGLGEDVIRSVGRYGLSGIDNATRARLRTAATRLGDDIGEQILDRGYYFKVPFRDTFKKLPGTAALDRMISPVFAGGRAALADTRLGTTLRNRLRTPEIMKEATEKLVTGRGTISFEDAAGIYLYTNAQRQLGNTATNRFLGEAKKIVGRANRKELDDMINLAEVQGGTLLNTLFDRAATFMQDAGINFYPRKNYVPHILSQGAVEWFRSDSKIANAFRQALIPGLDVDDISPRLMERHLLAGTTAEIGLAGERRTFNAGNGTLRDLNAEFARVFPEMKFKLFEDDIEQIVTRYSRHLGDDVGRAGGLKALLNSKSRLVRLRSDDDMVKTLIDEEALTLLNKQTGDMLRADHRALTDRITRLQTAQTDQTQTLQGVVGIYMRETVDELENLEPKLKGELDALMASESQLAMAAGRTSAMTGEAPASNLGVLEVKLQDAYARLEQRAMAADTRLADLQQQAARENVAWQTLQRMAGTDVGMMTVPEKFQALRQWNIAAAEAASLSMDRQAVATLRIELANIIRKADLAEALAENPATVGLRAGERLLPEERIGAGVRLRADGSIEEYVGPTAGRRGQRATAEAELYQREMIDYQVELEKYENAMLDWEDKWAGKEGRKPNKPKKPVKPKRRGELLEPRTKEAIRAEGLPHREVDVGPSQKGRLTVATKRIEWDANAKADQIITSANIQREKALQSLEALSLGPARQSREQLEARLLSDEAETELTQRWIDARQAMQADPNVRAVEQARRELPEVEQALARARDNLTKTPRLAAGDRREQAIRDAQQRIDQATTGLSKVWKIADGKVVLNDKSAKALDLYERYARLTKGGGRRAELPTVRELPEPTPGMVRLYRGEPAAGDVSRAARAGEEGLTGRWFTTHQGTAEAATNLTRGRIRYVDIPEEEFRRIQGMADQPEARAGLGTEADLYAVLPERYMSAVRDARVEIDYGHVQRSLTAAGHNEAYGLYGDDLLNYARQHADELPADLTRYINSFRTAAPTAGRQTKTTEQLAADITGLMGPFPNARNPRAEALARAERLVTQRQRLQRDLDLTIKGPGQLPKLKRDPQRAALEAEISTLDARRAQLNKDIAAGERKSAAVREQFDTLDAAVKQQQDTYIQLRQPVREDTTVLLMDAHQNILAKQAELAESERRVTRMAEIHRDNIDQAERRVEAAMNLDGELRRIEREMWGIGDEELRAARRDVQRHRDGELHTAKQEFEEAQKPVARARTRRDQVRQELDGLKDDLASGRDTPPEIGARIRQINNSEAVQLRDVKARMPRVKTEWRIFPEIDAPPRRAAYTYEQRDQLRELYEIVHNTHPVDRSGAGGSYMVRQARETVARITEQGGPKGPRDTNALIEANRVLYDNRMGRMNTAAHERYRRAVSEINRIERSVTESPTYAQAEFGEVRRIAGMVGELEELRTPLPVPAKGSKRHRALAMAPAQRTPGGPRDVIGMAKENHALAEDWLANYADDLIDTGAIEGVQKEYVAGLRDELAKWLDLYTRTTDGRRTPDVQSSIRSASNDLGRMVDIFLSAQASVAIGYEATPQLMTAVAAHRFMRERRRLDDSIIEIEKLLKLDPETRMATFKASIDSYENKIAIEQAIIDNPLTSEIDRKRAVNRRNNDMRQLGKKIDTGVVQPGEGDLRGVIEDDIDSMVSIVEAHLDEFEEASGDLRKIKGWRDVYLEPIEKQHRYQANTGRYELIIEELGFAQRRLQTSVTRARNAGRDTVSYTPTQSMTFTHTITEAERILEEGDLPESWVGMTGVIQNELRIARRRETAAQARARAAGRKGEVAPRMVSYRVRTAARKLQKGRTYTPGEVAEAPLRATEMSLADAEAELARYPMYLERYQNAAHKNQMQFETSTGKNQNRIAELEQVLGDTEAPLNEAGIRELKARAREIDAAARQRDAYGARVWAAHVAESPDLAQRPRPGAKLTLAQRRTPEEQAELDRIAARIEQSTSPQDPERIAAMQAELAERQGYRDSYEQTMAYDTELMGHVEDNGYRLMRELTQNLRAPTKAEARLFRQILGPEQGEEARMVLAALDDFIGDRSMLTDEQVTNAIGMIQQLASSRRIDDDALDRILPPDEHGRALNFEEMTRAAQSSSEVNMVLAAGGRQTQKVVDAEGFRDNFFQLLVEQATRRRQEAEQEIKHFTGWLDMAVNEDIVSTIGIVNKYLGGKLREFTKTQVKEMRAARKPIPTLLQRRRKVIRETIVEAMQAKGYDPELSLTRRLGEARTLRSRLNVVIRGLGLVLADGTTDMDELVRFWDGAALGEMGTISSLEQLTGTLRMPDDIGQLAKSRRVQLQREIAKATKAGDTDTAAALSAELRTINEGRYLPDPTAVPEPAAAPTPAPKRRRKAEPSEAAIQGTNDPPDLARLEELRTELAATEPRYLELDHQVATQSDELRAIQTAIDEAEKPVVAAEGVTMRSVIDELTKFAIAQRANVPEGMVSHAELELAMARNAAFAESLPPGELTPEQDAQMIAMADEIPVLREKLWAREPVAVRKQAKKIAADMPLGEAPVTAIAPDAQAEMVERMTELRRSIKAAQSELNDVNSTRGTLQAQIDELDRAHAQRSASDPTKETPSMVEDPVGASQAEGLPPEGMSPETAPTHLIEDSIYDSDASPEDLVREYENVVSQSRALLAQYGSYKDMPPDVRRSAGELANRAEVLAKRREEAFNAAAQGFTEGDETRLLAAAQQAGEAANPRIDMDWWSTISTGTPPSHVSTEIMRHPGRAGVTRRGVIRNQMRTAMKRGRLRGGGARRVGATPVVRRVRPAEIGGGEAIELIGGKTLAGGTYRGSLSARADVLAGRHHPGVRIKKRNPKTGRMKLQPLTNRPLTRFEQHARQVGGYNTAERDLRGIAERARAAAEPLAADVAGREASIAEREAAFLAASGEFAEQAVQRRAEAMVEQQTKLNHANDAVSQAQRHAQRVSGQRERINDAYTRALENQNDQLGTVRRRAIEVQLDHEAAARELSLFRQAMRDPRKKNNANLRQIWGDVRDLLEFKRSTDPIALYQAGTPLASQTPWWQPRVKGAPIDPMTLDLSSMPEVRQIEALLAAAIDQQDQIDQLGVHASVISKRLKDFDRAPKKDAFFTQEMAQQAIASGQTGTFAKAFDPKTNSLNEVFIHQVADGWQAIAEDMFTGPDALVIANTLKQAMDNIRRTTREPGFWKVIEKYTAFFSTYATARPGFHVRNAMSGTFMNMVAGVKLRNMRKAPGVWRDFVRDPEAFWARTGVEAERQKTALMAVFGSGAGGQFSERGLTDVPTVTGALYGKVMNNFITKANRKAGAYVEGPMRLAMALDVIERGGSLNAALDQITKFHFDYTQLSEFDVIARRMVPFWTFMSRNLPLQIESMWMRPRTYLQYQSLVRNFGEQMNPLTPDYWLSQGAFTLDENASEGEPWYLAPDLPHLRVAEPLTALAQGDLGKAVLSDINPLFLAPMEALAAGKKFYTGAPISDEPRPPQGAGEAMLAPLLSLLGAGGEGRSGQTLVDPRVMHITNSLLPPIELLNRLTSNEGVREGRQGETLARTMLGAPVYKLTEGVQNQTRRTRHFERLDERQRQAQLARL